MDPITQSSLGAVLPLATLDHRRLGLIALCGFSAGFAPDLDVFIFSDTDPLLFLEYHRQFTHALLFIPLGALIVSGIAYAIFFRWLEFKITYLACLLGYGTHGMLDACTSYGTQLFWPFSDYRVAWNSMSIVDPIFTLPLLLLIAISIIRKNRVYAVLGLIWVMVYVSYGFVQGARATHITYELAAQREHEPSRVTIKPSFGNLIVWKSIYEHDGTYYVDAVRTALRNEYCVPSARITKLDTDRDLPWLRDSQQQRDLERFRWFSSDYLALSPHKENFVIDVRYSLVPNAIRGLWGVLLNPSVPPEKHVKWIEDQELSETELTQFWDLIVGRSCQSFAK